MIRLSGTACRQIPGVLAALIVLVSLTIRVAQSAPQRSAPAIAHLQGGNLWTKALPDGQARQLTHDGRAHAPAWSPDARWVAFRDGTQVMVSARLGGSATALDGGAAAGPFAWSPSADTVAYAVAGSVHEASAPTWHDRAIVKAGGVTWSPGGRWLAYVTTRLLGHLGPGKVPERAVSLWRANATNGQGRPLFRPTTPVPYGLLMAGWSPDGRDVPVWIDPDFSASLLADGAALVAIPSTGGRPRQLVARMLAFPDFFAPSPAGSYLAVTEGGDRENWTSKRIAVINLTTGVKRLLTPPSVAAVSPAWSPDGQRLVYAAAPDGGINAGGGPAARAVLAQRRIWVMQRDGSGQHQLTNDSRYRDERPRFSADGSHVLFARLDQADQASLWLMRADGSDLREVATQLMLGDPKESAHWFGYYGHLNWDDAFAWWPGGPARLPAAGAGSASLPHLVPLRALLAAMVCAGLARRKRPCRNQSAAA
ncbi:MAG: TolB family protein [Chloroflexota bacterium]